MHIGTSVMQYHIWWIVIFLNYGRTNNKSQNNLLNIFFHSIPFIATFLHSVSKALQQNDKSYLQSQLHFFKNKTKNLMQNLILRTLVQGFS